MANKKYIIALDSGTTSCRTIVFNKDAKIVGISQIELPQHYLKPGWVEHNPVEIFNLQLKTLQDVIQTKNIKLEEIKCVGITNQRETVVVWDKETGIPLYNAIVWQDKRTAKYCESLIEKGYSQMIANKTGLIINPYFSASKIKWILENVDGAKQKLKEQKLLVGTIDSWLIWKLTNHKVHATDVTNASRTMLFNINNLEWDKEILDLFEIPFDILPIIRPTTDFYGYIESNHFLKNSDCKIPICAVAGDQQASLFGQLCTEVGMVKNTYGTGCFTLVNIGDKPILSKNKLLTTIAWKIKDEKPVYALEGSVFVAGSAIQWLRDGLKLISGIENFDFCNTSLIEQNTNVYFVPSFSGLGAPYWDSTSRGAIFGLDYTSKKEDIIRATLESIAFQTNDLINAMEKDIQQKIIIMKADGGISSSNYLMRFQASISNLTIQRSWNSEITALGIAYFAGLHSGFWKSIEDLKKLNNYKEYFEPVISRDVVEKKLKGWKQAVERTKNWTKDIE
ncbi:MAG: glycerol kinase GlpK [Malacoplasma sp.]|nr:glycerol kinase GlpK [Malacoplasma sp.]